MSLGGSFFRTFGAVGGSFLMDLVVGGAKRLEPEIEGAFGRFPPLRRVAKRRSECLRHVPLRALGRKGYKQRFSLLLVIF